MTSIEFKIGDKVRIESGVYRGVRGTIAGCRANPNGLGADLFTIDAPYFPALAIEVLADQMDLARPA